MIASDELIERLADPKSGFSIAPIIDATNQIGEGSIDIRLGPDIIVSPRATGATVFDPTDSGTFKKDLERRQKYVRRGVGDPFLLQPGEFVIGRSLEYLTLPADISAEALGRSSWGRLGLVIATATLIQPGFNGTITLELANVGDTPIMLTVGLTIAQLTFERCEVEGGEVEEDEDVRQGGLTQGEVERLREWRRRHQKAKAEKGRYVGQIKPALSRLDRDPDLSWVTPIAFKYVLGVVGERYAGKATMIDFLIVRRHFRLYRLSQFIEAEAKRRGMDWSDRRVLHEVGDEMREERGKAVLAQMAFREIREDLLDPDGEHSATPVLIVGFRLPEEIEAWNGVEAFRPVVVESALGRRRERAFDGGWLSADALPDYPRNGSVGERDSWFEKTVDRVPGSIDRRPVIAAARETDGCIVLKNDDTRADLQRAVEQQLSELEQQWRSREY